MTDLKPEHGDLLFYLDTNRDYAFLDLVIEAKGEWSKTHRYHLTTGTADKHPVEVPLLSKCQKISAQMADTLVGSPRWRKLLGWPLDKPEPEPFVPYFVERMTSRTTIAMVRDASGRTCYYGATTILAALEDQERLDKLERIAQIAGRTLFEVRCDGTIQTGNVRDSTNDYPTIREAIDARREG